MARERIKVTIDRGPPRQEDLFDGAGWMRAAERWAFSEGVTIDKRTVDQTFRAKETGTWYRITWDDSQPAGEEWVITWKADPAEAI